MGIKGVCCLMNEVKKDNTNNIIILFWIFIIGSIFGAYFEEIRHIIWYFRHYGIFNFSPRRGLFWGPLSPVYGIGAVVLAICLKKKEKSWIRTFLKAFILGGIVEYSLSFIQEFFTGTISWNYSHKMLNIGGRTTIPYMIAWGFIGVIFIYLIYPLIVKIIDKIPKRILKRATSFVFIIITIDVVISWSAFARKICRENDIEPFTNIGRIYDKYFDDEYFREKFPNMRKVKK